ncbi:MAG: hypothetical protein RBR63_11595, partial [Methanosarcina vacuolata]|nr:hypothetical protein [Methanosarcina vacuolata]
MSTEIWTDSNTQIKYQIGTIGWESFQKLPQLPDSIIPTYGIWAGPGWAPGVENEDGHQIRPKENSQINWAINPCMNDSVIGSSNPDQCFSILDAICKSHDWNYYQAEESGDNMEAKEMIILADTQLLKDIAAAVISGTYESPTGMYNEVDGTWAGTMYTGTFDSTEALYTTLLVPA